MSRPTTWDEDSSSHRNPRRAPPWFKVGLGIFATLILALGFSGLRSSVESPRLLKRIVEELSTEPRARALYQGTPGLQLGFGSEEAFLRHLRTWQPQFGETNCFQESDPKRFLPFAAKLEIQGSRGAWLAIMARLEPFPKLHGIAFGTTREQARRTCLGLYAKTHLWQWLDRGLAHAHSLAETDAATGLDTMTRQQIRALPTQTKALDPAAFSFLFTATGARLDLELAPDRTLSLQWKGEPPEAEIQWVQISGAISSR